MNISSPRRRASPAPSGPTDSMLASPTPTDIQDNNSSHSDTQLTNITLTSSAAAASAKSPIHSSGLSAAGSSIYPPQHQYQNTNAHDSQQRKNLKTTEYKSNFTPFDQYVYNEVTDSFVKNANNTGNNTLLIESKPGGRLSASNSNHDLASVAQSDHLRNSANAVSSATSPAPEFSVFEPNNGSDQHFDVTKEPWYKEVVRRNEKAHEYRFKSEVGHNSSLLMNASSNDDLISRKSPLNNDSSTMAEHSTTTTNGDDATTSSPAPNDELSSRRSYKFTPQDYKRDHLIATMADNNNFKLPKDDATSRATGMIRGRVQPTSSAGKTTSARPATRTPAQVRAKSQSSRLTSTTAASSARGGNSAASKSNQTTPVKTATPRPMTAARTSTASTRPARPTTASTTTSRLTTATTRTATSTNSAMKPASTVTSRRVPMSTTTSKPSTSTTTSRLAGTTSSGARTPVVGSTPRPTTARTTTLATPRTTTRSPATSSSTSRAAPSTQATPRSPVKRITNTTAASRTTTASSSRPSVSTSARNSLSASKTPTGRGSSASTASTSSNAVKSIKTKALADAGEKAAIAATTAAAAAATLMAASDSGPNETQNAVGALDVFASSEVTDPFHAESLLVQEQFPVAAEMTTQASQPIVNSYFNQEPNLIFNTSETGNMLADEIAQAEREANETYMKDLHQQSTPQDNLNQPDEMVAEREIIQRKSSADRDNIEKVADGNLMNEDRDEPSDEREATKFGDDSHDLVNGLSGRITSAEDRYDSSERETSADYNAQQADQQEQDNDDEPYSIMPTTYDTIEQAAQVEPIKTEQRFDESRDELKLTEPKEETVPVLAAGHMEEQVEVHENENLDKLENDHLNEPTSDLLGEQLVEQKSFERVAADTKAEDSARSGSDESLEEVSGENPKPEMSGKRVEFSSQPDIIESNHEHAIEDDHLEEPVKVFADVNKELLDLNKQDKNDVSQSEPNDLDDADEEFEILDPEREAIDDEAVSSEHSDKDHDVDSLTGDKTKPEQSAPVDDNEHRGSKVLKVDPVLNVIERSIEVDPSAPEADEILELHESTSRTLDVSDDQHSQIVPQQGQSKHDSDEFDEVAGQISSAADSDNDVISKTDDKQHQQSNEAEPLRGSDSAIDEQHVASEWQTNNKYNDSDDSGDEDEIIDHQGNKSELLMNVADLVGAESRKKEEMIRKSELARQQSNSRTSLAFGQPGEILLSPDQLHEQLTQTSSSSNAFDTISPLDDDVVADADNNVTRVLDTEAKTRSHESENDDSQFRVQTTTNAEASNPKDIGNNDDRGTADLVDFGSIDSVERRPPNEFMNEDHHHLQDEKKPDEESHMDFANEQTQLDGEQTPTQRDFSNIDTPKAQVDEFVNSMNEDHFEITNNQYPTMDMPKREFQEEEQTKSKSLHDLDPDDEEEQLKLSNHLTNSDDDVILEPRNTKSSLIDDVSPQKIVTGSRYNEGAGLGMMAQDERVEGQETAEIADGLSAEIDKLTVAENRVEIATSKSLMPEISTAPTFVHSVARFAQSGGNFNVIDDDDDDDEDLSLNPNADPIDVAATMSPSSSVAEEMLRLSRQTSNSSTTTNVTSKLIEELSPTTTTTTTTKNYAEEFVRRGSSHESHDEVNSKEQVKSGDGETNTTITISPSTKVEGEEEKEESGEERVMSSGRVELSGETDKMLQNAGILSTEAANNVVINNNNDKFNDGISAKKSEQQQNLKSGDGGDSDSEISDATSKAMMGGGHEASD